MCGNRRPRGLGTPPRVRQALSDPDDDAKDCCSLFIHQSTPVTQFAFAWPPSALLQPDQRESRLWIDLLL